MFDCRGSGSLTFLKFRIKITGVRNIKESGRRRVVWRTIERCFINFSSRKRIVKIFKRDCSTGVDRGVCFIVLVEVVSEEVATHIGF